MTKFWLFVFCFISLLVTARDIESPLISRDGNYVLVPDDSLFNTTDIKYFDLYCTREKGFFIPVAMKRDSVHLFEKTSYLKGFRHPTSDNKEISGPWILKNEFYKMFDLTLKTNVLEDCDFVLEKIETYNASKYDILGNSFADVSKIDSIKYQFNRVEYQIRFKDEPLFVDTCIASNFQIFCDSKNDFTVFRSEDGRFYFIYGEVRWNQEFGDLFITVSLKIRHVKENNH